MSEESKIQKVIVKGMAHGQGDQVLLSGPLTHNAAVSRMKKIAKEGYWVDGEEYTQYIPGPAFYYMWIEVAQ